MPKTKITQTSKSSKFLLQEMGSISPAMWLPTPIRAGFEKIIGNTNKKLKSRYAETFESGLQDAKSLLFISPLFSDPLMNDVWTELCKYNADQAKRLPNLLFAQFHTNNPAPDGSL